MTKLPLYYPFVRVGHIYVCVSVYAEGSWLRGPTTLWVKGQTEIERERVCVCCLCVCLCSKSQPALLGYCCRVKFPSVCVCVISLCVQSPNLHSSVVAE